MARPKAAVAEPSTVSDAVTIATTKPDEGEHRILLSIVDDQGRVKTEAWDMNAVIFPTLIERWQWEVSFYPALQKLMK